MTARGSFGSGLSAVSRGASLYTLAKHVSDGGEFVLHVLVSRWLAPASYGLFAYGKTLAFSALLLTNLGSIGGSRQPAPRVAHSQPTTDPPWWICRQYGPGRLPLTDRRDAGAGDAMATTAAVAAVPSTNALERRRHRAAERRSIRLIPTLCFPAYNQIIIDRTYAVF